MKEVSTAATKQSRNFSEQKLTIGLDLGNRSSYYCMLNEDGALMLEQKISITAKALQAAFGTMPHSRIALETGMHSPWISRLLSELGHEVIVAQSKCWMPCSLNNATARHDSPERGRTNLGKGGQPVP